MPTPTASRAKLFLPTTVPAECDGTFLNNEGRLRPFGQVFTPGEPLRVTGNGSHPPRTFRLETPGSEPRPAWALLAELCDVEPTLAGVHDAIAEAEPTLARLPELRPGIPAGRPELFPRRRVCVMPPPLPQPSDRQAALEALKQVSRSLAETEQRPSVAVPGTEVEGEVACLEPALCPPQPQRQVVQPHCLALLVVESLYGSELLASFSAPLREVIPTPHLSLHPADAVRLDLAEGARARLRTSVVDIVLPVKLEPRQAEGIAIVPRIRASVTGGLIPGSGVQTCHISRVEGA